MSHYLKKYVWDTRVVQYPFNYIRSYVQPLWNTEFTASQITDLIWISDYASACNTAELDNYGIRNIVTSIYGVGKQYPDKYMYHCVPVIDSESQKIEPYFEDAINFIDKCVKAKEPVLIHCIAGRSRSVTIVAAYLVNRQRMSAHDALRFLARKREIANPNPGFRDELIRYEQKVRKNREIKAMFDHTPVEKPKDMNIRAPFVRCPTCKANETFTDGNLHTTYPAQYKYWCNKCNYFWFSNSLSGAIDLPDNIEVVDSFTSL